LTTDVLATRFDVPRIDANQSRLLPYLDIIHSQSFGGGRARFLNIDGALIDGHRRFLDRFA
jgi:hypothetical protein